MDSDKKRLSEGVLFTDFYQLTMAQLYFANRLHEKEVQFEYFFRSYPDYGKHQAGYCIFAGLEWLFDWMRTARFKEEEISLLRSHKGRNNKPMFKEDFLSWLKQKGDFSGISMQAIPEGRVVHPDVPLVVVRGPFAMAQILESSLLNHLNYQTLIATKASRISEAGLAQTMIDFGMRRGQDKGANAGTRAALIGGADFSSNTGISYVLGYPPRGTHAHSMVQAFMALGEGELNAFRAYADIYPDDCLLLVDTIDTLKSGVPNAIKVFEELKKKGHKPLGIRLDSGDLAYLSIQSAKMLNQAGFRDVSIVLSNQLDELVIWQIISQIKEEAPRSGVDSDQLVKRLIYGVGTGLITSKGDAALDGIYKLTAVKDKDKWIPAIKLSESVRKIVNPGYKDIFRIYDLRSKATADLLSLEKEELFKNEEIILRHPVKADMKRVMKKSDIGRSESLLVDVIKNGRLIYRFPSIEEIRKTRREDLDSLDSGVKRLVNPHIYHVSLSQGLWDLKQRLVQENKEKNAC